MQNANDNHSQLRSLAEGPWFWTVADLRDDSSWRHDWTSSELSALDRIITSRLIGMESMEGDRSVSTLRMGIQRASASLLEGRGLFLFRGLDTYSYETNDLETMLVALASQFGSIAPQNLVGDTVRRVVDRSRLAASSPAAQGHRGNAGMLPHSDSADLVGLLCVRSAKNGGASKISSAGAVFKRLVDNHVELIDPLLTGFYFDMSGKNHRGVSSNPIPVFQAESDQLTCYYNRNRIIMGSQKAGVQLSEVELRTVERVATLALAADLSLTLMLQPGDLLLLNNKRILHGRDAYNDWADSDRKRMLLRVWVNVC